MVHIVVCTFVDGAFAFMYIWFVGTHIHLVSEPFSKCEFRNLAADYLKSNIFTVGYGYYPCSFKKLLI